MTQSPNDNSPKNEVTVTKLEWIDSLSLKL